MARARRRRRSRKCKTVTICGRRRKICWNSKGKITSNTATGRGGKRRKAKSRRSKKRRCKFGVNKRTGNCLKRARRKR